jgi:tRNA nucleotidyltransferase/poly(A) polymerase
VPTGIAHGTVTLPELSGGIEITTYRTDHGYSDARRPDTVRFGVDLVTDLERRDFTVNALVYEPADELVLDAVAGLPDLEAKLLRAVGDPAKRFREDALRPLRGARLAAVLEFELEPATRAALSAALDLVPKLSHERVRDELGKLLAARTPSRGLEALREAGLLALVLPELQATVGVHQNRHHAFDVYVHTLRAIDAAPADNEVVRWAALAHDLGKPVTRALKEDGDASFHGPPAGRRRDRRPDARSPARAAGAAGARGAPGARAPLRLPIGMDRRGGAPLRPARPAGCARGPVHAARRRTRRARVRTARPTSRTWPRSGRASIP